VEYSEQAIKKVLLKNEEQGFDVLDGLKDCLAEVEPWTGESAHAVIHAFAEGRQLGMGKVAQPLRVAVSGGTVSPPIDQTMEILGKEATLRRIERCLKLRRF
ncbi:MAG: glutamate--tRNA ligase, partial [Phycisphaerae bacterium]|nr:glutamate--tRNA ligase [Phycisphaerae bacterium]